MYSTWWRRYVKASVCIHKMLQESHWTKCESPFCHNVITTRMLVSEKSVNFRANYLVRCQWQDILWCEHLWLNVMANSHQHYCLLLSTEYCVACWTTCPILSSGLRGFYCQILNYWSTWMCNFCIKHKQLHCKNKLVISTSEWLPWLHTSWRYSSYDKFP